MTVSIDQSRCNGCGTVPEPGCVRVCPGDLLYRDAANKCTIRDARDCWDCAACVKECRRQAISLALPVQLGGRGSRLRACKSGGRITWQLTKPDGKTEKFVIVTQNNNSANLKEGF